MKKVIIMLAAVAAVAVSCQKEEFQANSGKVEVTIKGSVYNENTRVTYTKNDSIYKFAWEASDAFSLMVTDGVNTNVKFTNKSGEAGNNKEFTGTVASWEGQKNVYAVYPYSSSLSGVEQWANYEFLDTDAFANAKLKVSLNYQSVYADSNRARTSLLIASSENVASPSSLEGLSFSQVMSILNFNITNVPEGYKVTHVSIHCDDAVIPTKAAFSFSDPKAAPAILASVKDLNAIVKDAKAGTATQLYFSIIPTSQMNGKDIYVQVVLKGSSDSKMLNLHKSGMTFERNTIYTVNANCASAVATGQKGSVEYGGVTYNTVCLQDGNWWFAQNLRYLPANYQTPSNDLNNVIAGVYYPVVINVAGKKVEFSTEQAVIESNGYLYQSEVALGLKVGDITSLEQARSLEGTQGICPEGWHIPTASDIISLVGVSVSPFPAKNDLYDGAPYCDVANKTSKMSLLNADGFNANAWGTVSIADNTKASGALTGYLKTYPNGVASGFVCGSTFMKYTEKAGNITNYQFLGFMPMNSLGSFNGSALSYRMGAAVRCVRRATAADFE